MNWKRIAPLYADPEKRKQLKPEALWEFERCLKISGIDVRIAAGVRTDWYQVVRKLFERYDYLVLPSAQVFPFDVETHWPAGDRRQEDGHVSPLDGGDDPGHVVRMSGDRRAGRLRRARPADGDADRRPDAMQEQSLLQIAHAYDQATQWVTKVLPPIAERGDGAVATSPIVSRRSSEARRRRVPGISIDAPAHRL